jgi:hypothetical protein
MSTDIDPEFHRKQIHTLCKQIAEKMGFTVAYDSKFCTDRKKETQNAETMCDECESNKGCSLYMALISSYTFNMRAPTDEEAERFIREDWDFIKSSTSLKELKEFSAGLSLCVNMVKALPIYNRTFILQKLLDEIIPVPLEDIDLTNL